MESSCCKILTSTLHKFHLNGKAATKSIIQVVHERVARAESRVEDNAEATILSHLPLPDRHFCAVSSKIERLLTNPYLVFLLMGALGQDTS